MLVPLPRGRKPYRKAAIKVSQGLGIGHSTFQIEISGEFDPAQESGPRASARSVCSMQHILVLLLLYAMYAEG